MSENKSIENEANTSISSMNFNAGKVKSGSQSPTMSTHSFVSNVSSSTTPKKKWAFGYHKNVSVVSFLPEVSLDLTKKYLKIVLILLKTT
jgi:hypothetical protein